MSGLLHFRERLRPYLHEILDRTASDGTPPVRPLWFDHGHDPVAARVEDQFLLGSDLMVAPVLQRGRNSRRVYLPAGQSWRDVQTQELHEGGRWLEMPAPLEVLPLLVREGGALRVDAGWFDQPTE